MPKYDKWNGIAIRVLISHRDYTGPALLRSCLFDQFGEVYAYIVTIDGQEREFPVSSVHHVPRLQVVK